MESTTNETHHEDHSHTRRTQAPAWHIEVVDHGYIRGRWQEIEALLHQVFANARFNGGFTRARPAEHTWEIVTKPYQAGIKHILALDDERRILGAFFAIPTYRPPDKDACDLGWMFVAPLPKPRRREVLDAIVSKVHEVTRAAGFKRIVTEMGTEAGAHVLSSRYQYVHTPSASNQNQWTRELADEPEHTSNREHPAHARSI